MSRVMQNNHRCIVRDSEIKLPPPVISDNAELNNTSERTQMQWLA